VAVAELPAVEQPPDGPAIGQSNGPITSWLFIGAAVVLGVVLLYAARKRSL
jgi:hypothetical protein